MIKNLNLKKEDWYHVGKWIQPAFSGDFWLRPYGVYWIKLGMPKVIQGVLEINGNFYIHNNERESIRKFLNRICKIKDQKFVDNFRKITTEIFEEYKKVEKDLENPNKSLKELYDIFIEYSSKIMSSWYSSWQLTDFISEIIEEWSSANNKNLKEVIDSIPYKQTILLKHNKDILEIKKEMKKRKLNEKSVKRDKELWDKIQRLIEEYRWIGTHHFWGEPYSIEKFYDDMKNLEEVNKEQKKVANNFKFLATVASEFGYVRQYSAEIFDIIAFKAKKLLENIAEDLGIKYDELLLMQIEEIRECLNGRKIPSNLKSRKSYVAYIMGNESGMIFDKNQINKLLNEFIDTPTKNTKEIKGVVASNGYAKGKAKIFLIPKDVDKMKKGDILVTTMTTPDFVPLMKKSSAIITDAGGLLCHAAIISRELKKPCIISTKFATQVLKDGDLVEVDADKGIIKIIK